MDIKNLQKQLDDLIINSSDEEFFSSFDQDDLYFFANAPSLGLFSSPTYEVTCADFAALHHSMDDRFAPFELKSVAYFSWASETRATPLDKHQREPRSFSYRSSIFSSSCRSENQVVPVSPRKGEGFNHKFSKNEEKNEEIAIAA